MIEVMLWHLSLLHSFHLESPMAKTWAAIPNFDQTFGPNWGCFFSHGMNGSSQSEYASDAKAPLISTCRPSARSSSRPRDLLRGRPPLAMREAPRLR